MDYVVKMDGKQFNKRVTTGIRRAMKAGFIRKVGTRYHMGYGTETVRSEGFDMEEILPGEPMAMMPDGNGQSDLLTMPEIRNLWAGQLIVTDAAKELGVPEDRIAVRSVPGLPTTVSVVPAEDCEEGG